MDGDDPALQKVLAARGLGLGLSPGKGRGLFAARHFSRGDVLLEQDPYVSILAENVDSRCDGCYREGASHKSCLYCKSVQYCTIQCQRSEWTIHKEECKSLVKLMQEQGRTLTPSLRLMLRLLIKRKLQEDGTLPVDAMDNYQIIEALPTHIQETTEEHYVLYAQMANLVKSACTLEDAKTKDITHNFGRFACNAHTICDEELRPLGTGLYTVLSIINHSCTPNAVLLFDGKRGVVRAIEPIDEGTEVTASYVELGESTPSRRKTLKKQYFFDCGCPRCSTQGPSEFDMDETLSEGVMCPNRKCTGILVPDLSEDMVCQICNSKHLKIALLRNVQEIEVSSSEALRLLSIGNMLDARRMLEQVNKLQAQVFHKHSIQRLKTYDKLLKVCMSLEDWPSALKHCRQSLPAYERTYLPYHPLLGLQFYTCGKLEWYLGKTEEAIISYRRAIQILQVTHGSRSELVKNLKTSLGEAEAEASFLMHTRFHQ